MIIVTIVNPRKLNPTDIPITFEFPSSVIAYNKTRTHLPYMQKRPNLENDCMILQNNLRYILKEYEINISKRN